MSIERQQIDEQIRERVVRLDVLRPFVSTSQHARDRFAAIERDIRALRAQRDRLPTMERYFDPASDR